eukprot:766569-Hanusia_phi.AAC.2
MLKLSQALAKGLPDWTFGGRIWKPLDEEKGWEDEETAEGTIRHLHLSTRMFGTHTGDGPNLLKLEGRDFKPTGKEVVFPLEWWTLSINTRKVPPKIVSLQFKKVLDTSACSTGGYSLVPGLLFAIGKPLSPAPKSLQYPFACFPPHDAVDQGDPNWWQLRMEIFQIVREFPIRIVPLRCSLQITEKSPEEKEEMKRNIDRQVLTLLKIHFC